jgi:uncharacterized protein HemY
VDPTVSVLVELGLSLTGAGREADAQVLWEGLAELAPELELPWRALAVLAARHRRWPAVMQLASAALERQDSAAARLLRAEAWLQIGQFGEAERDLLAIEPLGDVPGVISSRARAILRRLRRP